MSDPHIHRTRLLAESSYETDRADLLVGLVAAIEQAAPAHGPERASLTPTQRADFLYVLVDAVYSAVKYDNPEGGGHDGRDGPERMGIAAVYDAALEHQDATHQRTQDTQ